MIRWRFSRETIAVEMQGYHLQQTGHRAGDSRITAQGGTAIDPPWGSPVQPRASGCRAAPILRAGLRLLTAFANRGDSLLRSVPVEVDRGRAVPCRAGFRRPNKGGVW
jgi:hypothetical protein